MKTSINQYSTSQHMIPTMASFRTYIGPAYYDSRQPVTMSFHIQSHIIGLLRYSSLREHVREHDGGAVSSTPVAPEGVTRVRSNVAQSAAQARHSQASIVLQREGLHAHLPFNRGGGVSDSLLQEDFQSHFGVVGQWSPSSSPQLLRQVELGFGVPR